MGAPKALLIALVLLCACQKQRIVVETRFLDLDSLASSVVGTPDPRKRSPRVGQELYISWRLPDEFFSEEDLQLLLTLRFGNREEISLPIAVSHFTGTYIYSLTGEEYWSSRGLLTYKVELFSGTSLLERWKHQIWSELIYFEESEDEPCPLDPSN